MLNRDPNREVKTAFCLFADCHIEYDGRASSQLERGNYLIIRKRDGSIQIHGATKVTPLNYQPPGGKLTIDGHSLIVRRKGEVLKIHIRRRIFFSKLTQLSDNKIVLVRTEREIVRNLRAKLGQYFPMTEFVHVEQEARTEVGPIDLLCIDSDGVYHVFEAKRAAITVNGVVQLGKYVEALRETSKQVQGYVVAPDILDNAQKHAEKRGVRFLRVLHETANVEALLEGLAVDNEVMLVQGE